MTLVFHPETQGATRRRLPSREEIPDPYKWNVQDIYANDADWEADFQRVEAWLPELDEYRGRLAESATVLLGCLQLRDRIEEVLGRLYLYAGLRSDEDSRVSHYQAMRDRVMALSVKANERMAFIQPEILAIPEDKLWQMLEESPELRVYRHHLEDLLRMKDHVLPPEQERLLAMAGEVAQGPYHIFNMFNNADIRFPSIRDENGQEIEVTKGRFQKLLESRDRRVRQDAFDAFYGTYENWLNTLAATLSTSIKRDIFYARARKYQSALEAALHADNIPLQVYENVVRTINENLAPLHRYIEFRRQRLQLDAVAPWDLFVPLVEATHFDFSYEEAIDLITEALQPLGETYQAVLQRGFKEGWIDVFENQGKRAGAYSWSTYGVHPFILLNYNRTLNDVFTIAHEMGHALHSFFTQQKQPFIYSHYTIFVAEVASTLNEALLMEHLLNKTTDPEKKLYLLNEYADQIRGTVYIQTLFAEFEKTIHEKVEAGEALTAELLSALKEELYTRYFGPAFRMHPRYRINWCRIPHFYYNFYVYKYVTGYAAATALAQRILSGEPGAREAYLDFLSRGNSDYSLNLLRQAGVDMTSPEPIQATTRLLDRLVQEMETIVNTHTI
ncbi:MAG: oligoendopeptidase F [Calditrichaeota bacterium]|nr:oligoendopeptidase F [Calditrichota bacterium]